MLIPQLYILFLVSLVHQAVTLTRQPYGTLMCKELGQSLTNNTDLVKFDPLHLKCRIADLLPEEPKFQMKCVMCTEFSDMTLTNQQICQTVEDNTICTFISNDRACVFTKKRLASDTWYFDAKQEFRWINSKSTGLFCAPGLQKTIAENQPNEGDSITVHLCKKRVAVLFENMDIWRARIDCTSSIFNEVTKVGSSNWLSMRQLLKWKNESINCHGLVNKMSLLAQSLGHHDIFCSLVCLGAELSMTYPDYSLLQMACIIDFSTLNPVKKLVELGFDIEQRTRTGEKLTPFLLSVMYYKIEIMNYFISIGCKVDVVTATNKNALHLAAMVKNVDAVEQLLKIHHRIGLNGTDQEGNTPLHYAQNMVHTVIARKIEAELRRG